MFATTREFVRRRWVQRTLKAVGVAITIFGVAGLPDNLRTWWGWLGSVARFLDALDTNAIRWLALLLGLGMIALGSRRRESARGSDATALLQRTASEAPPMAAYNPHARSVEQPPFSVAAMPPVALGVWFHGVQAGYACRLRLHTGVLGGTFVARVQAAEGMNLEDDPPWYIRWRDFDGARAVIPADDQALLDLVIVRKASLVFPLADGREWHGTVLASDRNGAALMVRVTHLEANEERDYWFGIRFDGVWAPTLELLTQP